MMVLAKVLNCYILLEPRKFSIEYLGFKDCSKTIKQEGLMEFTYLLTLPLVLRFLLKVQEKLLCNIKSLLRTSSG